MKFDTPVVVALVWVCSLLQGAGALRATSATFTAAEERQALKTFASAAPFIEGLVGDISRLQRSLRQAESFLQLDSKPAEKKTVKSVAAPAEKKVAKSEAKPAQQKVAKSEAKPAEKKEKSGFDVQDAVAQMGKMGPGQMASMLGLMKGMYANWKEKISDANKHEQEEKKKYENEIGDLDQKKLKFKGDANATKTYDNIEKYWRRQRELSHRQYHTALKLMHSGMSKFKTMIGAYEDAIAGKKPTAKDLQAIGQQMPEVVLLQQQVKQLTHWAKSASAILRDARNPHPGMKYT